MHTLLAVLTLNILAALTFPGDVGPGGWRSAKARTLAASSAPQDFVVLGGFGVARPVDPVTGEERWHAGARDDGIAAAVVGSDGLVYVSVSADDGSGTEAFAVRMPAAVAEPIGRVAGLAMVKALAPAGDRLILVRSAGGLPVDLPSGETRLPIPDDWQSKPLANSVFRDIGGGVLSPDGDRWFGLRRRGAADEATVAAELRVAAFAGDEISWSNIPVPMAAGFHSLLVSPDGDRVYVVDYLGQAVQVVDPARRAVVRSFDLPRTPTKRPPCAASLSPEGDRLYVVGHNEDDTGDGVLVFDIASGQEVGHLVPGKDLYCLAVSPDGDLLYAVTMELVDGSPDTTTVLTIDAQTGEEVRTVPLAIDGCGCPFPVAVVSAPRGDGAAG